MLVSTPLHLKALERSVDPVSHGSLLALSATAAPLPSAQAQAFAGHFGATLLEIYGCSEIGSLAARDPLAESAFAFFPWLNLRLNDQTLSVQSPYLATAVELSDRFDAAGGHNYTLLGRASDLVKVAGKRESLARLNQLLVSIDGVEDGVFYVPEAFGLPPTGRLGALVVAPTLDPTQLREELADRVDAAFLPRPLRTVRALPRAPSTKLEHEKLKQLLNDLHAAEHQSSAAVDAVGHEHG